MKKPYDFFLRFTKQQQKGVVALLLLILVVQLGYYICVSVLFTGDKFTSQEEKEWLSHQTEIDRLQSQKSQNRDTIFPFNPNYISDYKAYVLGINLKQLNKLNEYRQSGAFINSAQEFQNVTGVHDTVLAKLSPYFRFPVKPISKQSDNEQHVVPTVTHKDEIVIVDINKATREELIKIHGIGDYYSKLIIERREQLGGYVSMEQMDDFSQIPQQAIILLKEHFQVIEVPQTLKINVNNASLNQLSRFPYFDKDLARAIITHRSMLGKFVKIEDLLKINGFPVQKEKIIALYLEF
ncbi:helix-hairpin-helix domain-containing protein [Flavobacterium rakeshii]|uniref:ComEA family DNA-binding protein n=1 Tax=Flavobacterium rakeshii TaxID=1038845 RepID=UPI002E7B119D|nr:helix-hairpin-helix domain-containing protein [Flavobacterium rakeshii]MEE1899261.1 helix-hairpin-helix domain-containing protein [Flavobacterium rakeshii]